MWLARLDAIYGGLKEDFGKLKEKIIKAGEEYFSVTLVEIKERIEQLANKGQNVVEVLELESLSRKKQLLLSVDLSIILKLQYL